ncbi:hypothetical protein [Thermoactinomyces mirandus]|uniref:Uncharacterized protein n=1 Tax=Thermoactinomyces mirandus TaxID=2756294 RepID=A0A7W1XS00_9BACL|nr:hypothetical protein [Thermoactinomyces mirandus]MBA4602055.1 hypothetical protein [Thermoactinomyces mirandus]
MVVHKLKNCCAGIPRIVDLNPFLSTKDKGSRDGGAFFILHEIRQDADIRLPKYILNPIMKSKTSYNLNYKKRKHDAPVTNPLLRSG